MDAGLAPILFLLVVLVTAVQPQITKEPVNALKKVGDSVTLECVKKGSNCDGIEWKKMEGAQSPKTVYRDGIILNGFQERYSVNSTIDCSLTITRLQISDSGKFSCSLTEEASEVTKGSTLVVIDVTELCRPPTSITEMTEGDSYSFSTSINVPAKSVEPSNVTLSFQDLTASETQTTDDKQPPTTVKTTLTGTMIKANVTQHGCNASFIPAPVSNFDNNLASLKVCTTPQLIRSYPVEGIVVSPSGPYYKGLMVSLIAEGYPSPKLKCTHSKSGEVVVNGHTLEIDGEAGDEYTCTATNTVKGKVTSQSVTIEVSSVPACSSGCVTAIVICVVLGVIIIIVVVLFACYKFNRCPFYTKFHSITGKQSSDKNGEMESVRLHATPTSDAPVKPPRVSDTPAPANV